jgi:hypothetical protein
VTQEISRHVFAQADEIAAAAFTGIKYASRLGDDMTNWAIFEPNDPVASEEAEIADDDEDLLAVLDAYDLTLVDDE